ncbi:MAG: thioredoxin-dependent thiol peroxidase [Candidatus Micrarchaeaceae archaeon]
MAEEGDKAPDFELVGNDNKKHTLSEFKGKRVVVYFYPKDNTPGCTAEACSFRDSIKEVRSLGAEVIGISKDTIESHSKFSGKYSLNFLLLSDPNSKTIKAFGAYGSRGIFGFGTLRKTYVIGTDGKIERIFENIKPEEHAKKVIEYLKGFKKA